MTTGLFGSFDPIKQHVCTHVDVESVWPKEGNSSSSPNERTEALQKIVQEAANQLWLTLGECPFSHQVREGFPEMDLLAQKIQSIRAAIHIIDLPFEKKEEALRNVANPSMVSNLVATRYKHELEVEAANLAKQHQALEHIYLKTILTIGDQLREIVFDPNSKKARTWTPKEVRNVIVKSCTHSQTWPQKTNLEEREIVLVLLLLGFKGVYEKKSWHFPNLVFSQTDNAWHCLCGM